MIIEVSHRRKITKRLMGTIRVTLSKQFSQLRLGKKSRALILIDNVCWVCQVSVDVNLMNLFGGLFR